MPDTGRCMSCGAEIPPGLSSDGLCPACLLKLGAGRPDAPEPANGDPTMSALPHHRPRFGSDRMIPAGQQFGPYRIERLLGKGGMGEVYEAVEENGRRVALKVLTHGLDDPSDRARFLREGRLAASISHPHTVNVYGTYEIEGVPVIAMEMATGGTLKDRVKEHGPLGPAEAVDVILQVIAGLEAAAAGGILHRDLKPSNCFVDSESRVKVGDFGISISTLARAEGDLTLTGTFLGTPAFAAPEQLRGDELDVRSDIYSVGATLYYLLTGRPPFEDANLLKLVTMVAQDPPRPLMVDVPTGLAAVVTTCLAKSNSDRFSAYATLAKELEPFGSTVPNPAGLGLRVAAGVIDWFVLGLLLSPVVVYLEWKGMESPAVFPAVARQVAYLLVGAAYFAVLESRFGSSVGKALCRLRVIGLDRSRLGLARALARGALFALAFWAPSFFVGPEETAPPHPPLYFHLWGTAAQLSFGFRIMKYWYMGLVILFITVRRRNGFAGLHDFLSQTRVVVGSPNEKHPTTRHTTDFVNASVPAGRVGPYQVVDRFSENLLLGYDGRLRRKVWIGLVPLGTPALLPHRRDLSRPGRLHWLTGQRGPGECWDAYEAVEGTPLVTLLSAPHPWSRVRHWLHDLAAELGAGLNDGTIPDLALDRVWITPDDHAKLLDWQAPGVSSESGASHVVGPPPADLQSVQKFLSAVASSALLGRVVRGEHGVAVPADPLPLSARGFLQELDGRRFRSLRQVRDALDSLIASPARVSPTTRWVHLAICGALPTLLWISVVPGYFLLFRWAAEHSERFQLATCVHQLYLLEQDAGWPRPSEDLERIGLADVEVQRIVRALQAHVAQQFRARSIEPSTWEEPFMDRSWRSVAARALAAGPSPSAADLDDAANIMGRFLENRFGIESRAKNGADSRRQNTGPPSVGYLSVSILLMPLMPLAALGPLSAAIFRGGLLLRLLGVGVVNASGKEASRVRAFVRAAIAWSPFVVVGLAVFLVDPPSVVHLPWFPPAWLAVVVLPSALLASVAWSASNPQHGLQDRLAGTHLVPR